jgi:DNA-binding beta-propeller fold protein YncE
MPQPRRPGRCLPIAAALLKLTLVLALAAGMAGCLKPPPAGDGRRYLWPPSADARIEYLASYAGDSDLQRGQVNWFEEVVLGKEHPEPLFRYPYAVDARSGRVAVVDQGLGRVVLLDLAARRHSYIGDPTETEKGLVMPMGVALTDAGEILVVDAKEALVRRYALDGRPLGAFGEGRLERPGAIAVDRAGGRLVVVDIPAHRLAIFSTGGDFFAYLGERGGGPGQFNFPVDADFGPDGALYVLDSLNARVQKFLPDGESWRFAAEFGERGTAAGSFSMAKALAVTPAGHVYVTDALSHKVVVFDGDGNFLLNFGGKSAAQGGGVAPGGFYMPRGIAADENDGIWVVDSLNRMVHRFQYLNAAYLREHPIRSEQLFHPAALIGGGRQ